MSIKVNWTSSHLIVLIVILWTPFNEKKNKKEKLQVLKTTCHLVVMSLFDVWYTWWPVDYWDHLQWGLRGLGCRIWDAEFNIRVENGAEGLISSTSDPLGRAWKYMKLWQTDREIDQPADQPTDEHTWSKGRKRWLVLITLEYLYSSTKRLSYVILFSKLRCQIA